MSNLLPQFLKNIPDVDTPILVAVSGGVDSMVLLHLFQQSKIPCVAAHCNFQLRGSDSDEDEAFIREKAEKIGIAFYATHFETKKYAHQNGISIQEAARNLRYQWFAQLCIDQGWNTLATGHHLNDHIETALFNWIRGTGIAGLTGIPRVGTREDGRLTIIRPLLGVPKIDIINYAHENGIAWREDSSNAQTDYTRNAIRHRVMPVLSEIRPDFLQNIAKTAENLSDTASNYQYLLKKISGFQLIGENVLQIDWAPLSQVPDTVSALWELLKPYGFTPEQARQISTGIEKTGLELYAENGNRLNIDRGRLLLTLSGSEPSERPDILIEADDLMVKLPDGSRIVLMQTSKEAPLPDGKTGIVVDYALLQFPLRLRRWQPGDIFQPFGMAGKHKKVHDFLTDLKLSRLEKERIMVLINGDGAIIWLVGFRLDNRFMVGELSENYHKINWIK